MYQILVLVIHAVHMQKILFKTDHMVKFNSRFEALVHDAVFPTHQAQKGVAMLDYKVGVGF